MTFHRDQQRLEEEIAGAERPLRPESLSSDYLMQALENLHDAGDPAALFAYYRRFPNQVNDATAEPMEAGARQLRLKSARTAVLFASLAGEAYVNEFLRAHLDQDADFRAVERMSTVDKYFVGTRLVYGERIFFRDREGATELRELFELRNRLVHPKPGFGVPGLHGPATDEFASLFALSRVAEFIVAVAGYADAMTRRAYGFDQPDLPAVIIWRGRTIVRDWAARQSGIPSWDAPAERQLFRQVSDYVMSLPPLPDHPDASWTQLRKAREALEARRAGDAATDSAEPDTNQRT